MEFPDETTARIPFRVVVKLIILASGFALFSTINTGEPILFLQPRLTCLDRNGLQFACSQESACSNPYGYIESVKQQYPQIRSITSELNLHCNRETFQLRFTILAATIKIIACVILYFISIPIQKKERIIYSTMVIAGCSLCSLTFAQHSISFFGIVLLTSHFMQAIFYGLMYSYIVDMSPDSLRKLGVAYTNIALPFAMTAMITFSYFFGAWKHILVHFTGIPMFILGLIGFALHSYWNDSHEIEVKAYLEQLQKFQQSLYEELEMHRMERNQYYLNQMMDVDTQIYAKEQEEYSFVESTVVVQSNKQTSHRKNEIVWVFGWICNMVCIQVCNELMNKLHGELFISNLGKLLLDAGSSVLAVAIAQKYSLKRVIILLNYLLAASFFSIIILGIILSHSQISESTNPFGVSLQWFLQIVPLIIVRSSSEILRTVLILKLAEVLSSKDTQNPHQKIFGFACGCATFVSCICLPWYTKIIETTLRIPPLIGYGVACLVAGILARNFVDFDDEKAERDIESAKQPLLNIELSEISKISTTL